MILRNSALNFAGLALPLLVGLVTVPLIIQGLGVDRFAVLTLIWSLVGYVSIFDFGIARALTKRVAELAGSEGQSRISVGTGLAILLVFGIFTGLCILVVYWFLPLNNWGWLGNELLYSVLLLAACMPFVMLSAGLRAVLEGVDRFGSVSAVRLYFGLLTFGVPALLINAAPRLDTIIGVLLLGRISGCLALAYVCRDYLPQNTPPLKQQLEEAGWMFRFGGWVTVSNLISPIMVYMDRFLVAATPYAGALAYYTTPYEFITRLFIIPSALTGVLFPRIARYGEAEQGRKVLLVSGWAITLLIMTPMASGFSLFAPEILGRWINQDFASHAALPLQLLAAGVLINSLAQVSQTYLLGTGHASWMARLHLVELLFYLPVLYCLLNAYGINGVAFAWLLRVTIDAGMLAWKSGVLSGLLRGEHWWVFFSTVIAGFCMIAPKYLSGQGRLLVWCGITAISIGLVLLLGSLQRSQYAFINAAK